jgi:hypothetical protein
VHASRGDAVAPSASRSGRSARPGLSRLKQVVAAPFFLWGDSPATRDVYRNTAALAHGMYRPTSTVDGGASDSSVGVGADRGKHKIKGLRLSRPSCDRSIDRSINLFGSPHHAVVSPLRPAARDNDDDGCRRRVEQQQGLPRRGGRGEGRSVPFAVRARVRILSRLVVASSTTWSSLVLLLTHPLARSLARSLVQRGGCCCCCCSSTLIVPIPRLLSHR